MVFIKRFLADHRIRFLIVGGINTLVGYGVYALLVTLIFPDVRLGYVFGLVVSYACAITLAFFLYRRYVFPVSGRLVRDFIAFVGVYAFAILMNLALLTILVEIAGVPPLAGQAIALAVTTLISFFGHREISFRRTDGKREPSGRRKNGA